MYNVFDLKIMFFVLVILYCEILLVVETVLWIIF